VRERVDTALAQWNEYDYNYTKFKRTVLWLRKNYKSCTGLWYDFAKEARKLADKGRLIIHKGTVLAEYSKKPLSQENYDGYAKVENKDALIVLAVVITILIIIFLSSRY
jgi:hypothetical protein